MTDVRTAEEALRHPDVALFAMNGISGLPDPQHFARLTIYGQPIFQKSVDTAQLRIASIKTEGEVSKVEFNCPIMHRRYIVTVRLRGDGLRADEATQAIDDRAAPDGPVLRIAANGGSVRYFVAQLGTLTANSRLLDIRAYTESGTSWTVSRQLFPHSARLVRGDDSSILVTSTTSSKWSVTFRLDQRGLPIRPAGNYPLGRDDVPSSLTELGARTLFPIAEETQAARSFLEYITKSPFFATRRSELIRHTHVWAGDTVLCEYSMPGTDRNASIWMGFLDEKNWVPLMAQSSL
jgi:hypothetical protein